MLDVRLRSKYASVAGHSAYKDVSGNFMECSEHLISTATVNDFLKAH